MLRKHKGIIQVGQNKGKLRKGFKYTGQKTKTGLPIIKECKKNKKKIKIKILNGGNTTNVIITHNAGFFSNCSIRLNSIINNININNKLPKVVDCSQQYSWYKNNKNKNKDITFHYFEHYDNIHDIDIKYPIKYHQTLQYSEYSKLDYNNINPLIKKYFSLSKNIDNIKKSIENKYNLDYKNICVLFYRGNDKNRETIICKYEEYLIYANSILRNNPKIKFLIQSDESEFITFMLNKFPKNSFYFKDEIRHINKQDDTVDKIMRHLNYKFSQYYLAITIIMSKCKYIICGSGNCSIWIMLYRGNSNNVIQFLNGKWYNNINF